MAGGPGAYVLGAEEKKELLDVIDNGALFRYGTPGVDGFQGKVATFEKEMAEQLGHKYVVATNAGIFYFQYQLHNGLQFPPND